MSNSSVRRLSRRDLLRTLCVGAGAVSPLAGAGKAASAERPRRILFLDNQYGVVETGYGPAYDDWVGPASHGATDVKFKFFLELLEPHRKDIVVLDGLEYQRPVEAANTHAVGHHQMLTGRYAPGVGETKPPLDHTAAHISIDQYLAQKIGRTATPKFPSLVLGVGPQNFFSLSHNADGTNIKSNRDPYDIYNKNFMGLINGAEMPNAELKHKLEIKKSVLDVVAKDIVAFKTELGKEDRARAEAQLDGIRAMEQRLGGASGMGATCEKAPLAPSGLNPNDAANGLAMYEMHLDVLAMAVACDLTRFATLCFQGVSDAAPCPYAPFGAPKNSFHSMSHNENKDGHVGFRNGKRHLYGLVGNRLVERLKRIPEGDGSVLDNTIVFVGSDIGAGHNNVGIPTITVGGRNLGVYTGKYLKYGGRIRYNSGTAHNRLLVSFLNAMGMPDEEFGEMPAINTGRGPLPDYLVKG